jgi:hypothetical protein
MLGAILGDPSDEQTAPVASAFVNLNDSRASSRQNPRCAELVMVVEPRDAAGAPAQAAVLKRWHERLVTALEVPAVFALFLEDKVGVETYDDPAVQVGLRLQAQPNLGALVDITSLEHTRGSVATSDFPSYFVAERAGRLPTKAAVDVLSTWCDHALHLDRYEELLATFV